MWLFSGCPGPGGPGATGTTDASGTVAATTTEATTTEPTTTEPTTAEATLMPTDSTCADACPVCGDGEVQSGEECDDANTDDTDECPGNCKSARCGDGFVKAGAEVCDDGNADELDGCSPACEVEKLLYVFVTEDRFTGLLGGNSGADAECDARAQAAGLPGVYRAWLSTAGTTQPYFEWLQSDEVIYLRPDKTVVAQGWSELTSGTLRAPIAVTEAMTLLPGEPCAPDTAVWTNTDIGGGNASIGSCVNWDNEIDVFDSVYGSHAAMDKKWTDCDMAQSCDKMARIYCMQQATEGCMFPDCN